MVQIKQLSNGLTVVLEQMDHLRSVSFGAWVKVGSVNENEKNNGISHVVEHMMFKGTTNRSAKELADDCAMIGGNLNAYTSKECTSYYVTTLDTHLERAIEIISDMLCNSLMLTDELEKEKGVIIEEIDMYDDSPEDLVHELLQKEVWKDHPLGYIISGTKEIVESITREDLLSFIETYYVADNMVLSIAGNFNIEKTMEVLEQYFGKIPATSNREVVTDPSFTTTFVHREKDIEQIHINLAFEAVDYMSDEKYPLSLVNSVLGGSESSLLFQKIREELGLAYSIYSYSSTFEQAGLFQIDVTVNPDNVETVLKTIIDVINGFVKTGINEVELLRSKEQINTELIIGSESSKNRMTSNGKAMLCRKRIVSLTDTIDKLNGVTVEEANTFIKKYLTTSRFSLCMIGNLQEIDLEHFQQFWRNLNNL